MSQSYKSSINHLYSASPIKDELSIGFGNRSRVTQTDKRIEEIKKKYDTPNRRERLSSQLSSAKKSQYLPVKTDDYKNKQNSQKMYSHETCNRQNKPKSIISSHIGNSRVSRNPVYDRDYLKQSTAINRSRHIDEKTLVSSSQVNNIGKHVSFKQNKRYETNTAFKNEEEQFFKKVKQMKQSLLYSDNSNFKEGQAVSRNYRQQAKNEDLNWNLGSHKKPLRQSRSNSQFYQSKNPGVEKDRIDNIDKINEKIKGILQCLNENDRVRPTKDSHVQRQRERNNIIQEIQRDNRRRSVYQQDLRKSSTPVKSGNLSTSIIETMSTSKVGQFRSSKERFHHRHERSDLLQKIEITKPTRKQDGQDDKWQKLSNKLEKYEMENKLRIQKALQNSKGPIQTDKQSSIPFQRGYSKEESTLQKKRENKFTSEIGYKPNSRSVYEPSKAIQASRTQNKSIDVAKGICTRSFVGSSSIKHRDMSAQPKQTHNYQLQKSGKKLDDEIDRLQQKIKQFEEEKKRMNINFKPFNYSNTKSTSALQQHNYPKKYDLSERKISEFGKIAKSANKIETEQTHHKGEQKFKTTHKQAQSNVLKDKNMNLKGGEQYSFQNGDTDDCLDKKKSRKYCDAQSDCLRKKDIQIKLEKSNESSAKTSKFISRRSHDFEDEQQSYAVEFTTKEEIQSQKMSHRQEAYFYDDELKKKTDSGIQQRKRLLMNGCGRERPVKTDLKKLVQDLVKQVELDEELRNNKIWLDSNYSEHNKQASIKKALADKFSIHKSQEDIHQVFRVRETENNPFFTAQGYSSSIDQLVEAYVMAERNWNEHLLHRYNREALIGQGFTAKEIDLERKNFINLEDLVRFLNLESGTFYRNRDLAIIFMRVCQGSDKENCTGTTFDKLLATFCNQ